MVGISRLSGRSALLGGLMALILGLGACTQHAADELVRGGVSASTHDLDRHITSYVSAPAARRVVAYETNEPPGSIIVSNSDRALYLVLEEGKAYRYGVGVGREGFSWTGRNRVSMKREWPDWRPPPAMRRRQPDLPVHMRGGPANPLGARALYIGSTLYRIHGSNEPHTIGQAVSSGCIRMTNADVQHLYDRVRVGARVVVRN
ncbi:MAG: L,D-transpeptidase [Salinarimonas sp.]|nr:L,D-transpeptidase [Salinarimonas sp.]